jgi:hypothetical protein
MIVIFGSTNKGNRERSLLDSYCFRCKQETTWDWYRLTEWITLFFVPLLPTTSEHFLVCTGCHDQLKLLPDETHGIKHLNQLPGPESKELHDRIVQRLEQRQLADKTATQREFLKNQRGESTQRE